MRLLFGYSTRIYSKPIIHNWQCKIAFTVVKINNVKIDHFGLLNTCLIAHKCMLLEKSSQSVITCNRL